MAERGTLRGEMATLPVWLRWPLWVVTALCGGFFGLILLALALAPFIDDEEAAPSASRAGTEPPLARTVLAAATANSTPPQTPTPRATSTPAPTATSTPTTTPTPTATPTPTPIALSGTGQGVVSDLGLGSGMWVAGFTHGGRRNFIVTAYDSSGRSDLLINRIGPYSGTRPLIGGETYTLDIDADGAWTVEVVRLGSANSESASGTGDAVSGTFKPPSSPATFFIQHNGERNFIASLHCDGGSALVQNEIGPVSASRVVRIPRGSSLCFWEVEADGSWRLSLE